MPHVHDEIGTQPACWRRAAELARVRARALPRPGERVAVIGCGTSWFMAMAYALRREQAGQGETDAFQAAALPPGRRYHRLLAITRSGTTTEVLAALGQDPGRTSTVIVGDPGAPAAALATETVAMPFADERSVVQTRFATSTLALLRSHLGEDLEPAVADAEAALADPLPLDPAGVEQVTFLGDGWAVGLAHEAALKCREAAQLWAEAYPAMDYRHGPIAIAAPGRAVWPLGPLPAGLAEQVRATGATLVAADRLDPMAELVRAQRFAVAVAARRGLDPDVPRHLTRSVVLPEPAA